MALLPLLLDASAGGWPDLSDAGRLDAGDGSRDVALVVGIENYVFAPDLDGATDNARDWVTWLRDARGVPTVKVLLDTQATREEILDAATGVADRAVAGGRIWVVYIGHGAPSRVGDDGVLVGVDAQQTAASLEARSVRQGELLDALDVDGTETVLVVDACFSGKTSSGDLAPGLAPLKAVDASLSSRATVLTAARSDEFAGPLSDGSRPAFSYLVLGALRGWGDRNGDGRVTVREAVDYADDPLFQTVTGRSQSPTWAGSDLELARGREAGPDLGPLAMVTAAPSSSAGQAQIELGGNEVDYAAMAARAAEAARAREQAEAVALAAERALQAERRRRLDEAAEVVLAQAARDFAAIEALVRNPTAESVPVLEQYVSQYGEAKVTIDGVSERVEVPSVAEVEQAIARAGRPATTGRARSGILNLNTASAAEIQELPGFGPAKAAALRGWLDEHGPCGELSDVDAAPGIGPTTLSLIHGHADCW